MNECNCSREKKVPTLEHDFLIDQRTARKMCIGSIDRKTTKQLQQRDGRKAVAARDTIPRRTTRRTILEIMAAEMIPEKRPRLRNKEYMLTARQAELPATITSSELSPELQLEAQSSEEKSSEIEVFSTKSRSVERMLTANTIKISNIARAADRYGVGDTPAAAIATAAYVDAGLVTDDSTQYIIDRSKVRRARLTLRRASSESLASANAGEVLHAIFFDGRKDLTKMYECGRINSRSEEHISMVREPGSLYFSHISPDDGYGITIATALHDRFLDKNVDTSAIKAAGCDGANVNVGTNNGVIYNLELLLNQPLQWFVCLLHANELPLRVLLREYVGVTKGPTTYSGPIGAKLNTCETKQIVQFQQIDFDCDFDAFTTLNKNNKYLLDICKVISTGEVPPNFEHRSPGNAWCTL